MAAHRNLPRAAHPRRAGGFSLVELIVTLVVLSIVTAVSVPMITSVVNASRITGGANELLTGIQLARMEAIRRNVRTSICQSTDGLNCSNGGDWRGWVVFADLNNNNLADANERVGVGRIEAPLLVRSSSNITNSRITFRADGMAYSGNTLLNGNIRVCLPTTNPATNARNVNLVAGGRVSVGAAVNVGTTCPTPGN
jgi:type IV fimbrial biogenesis protein FimT